jgi:MFS transporter, SP family, general alpha glucoside:H+ symporter
MWPVPILVGVIFAPESPWWLVRRGRKDDAKKALLRLTTQNDPSFNADQTIAMMVHTNEIEKEISSGTTYWDCFKGIDLRRTEIACVVWAIQNLCGSPFMGFSTYFYTQAGLPSTDAFDLSMAQYALGAIGTMGSWWLMTVLGRRTLYIAGLCIMTILLVVIGCVGFAPSADTAAKWAVGSMLLVFTFVYDITVGPVCYSLVAEISSTRLRSKTIVLARNVYNVVGIVDNVITPRQLNPSAWNWGPKAGFFWAGLCLLCVIWSFFRLPEPKDRTYGELDILFERKVSARKFKGTIVDPFHGDTLKVVDPAQIEKNGSQEKASSTHVSEVFSP